MMKRHIARAVAVLGAAAAATAVSMPASFATTTPPGAYPGPAASGARIAHFGGDDNCLVTQGSDNGSRAFGYSCDYNVGESWSDQHWDFYHVTDYGAYAVYEIVNNNSNKCLEVQGWSKDNGAAVDQWDCHGGANQRWVVYGVDNGSIQLKNKNSGKCLVVQYHGAGTQAMQYDCNAAWSDQQWDGVGVDNAYGTA